MNHDPENTHMAAIVAMAIQECKQSLVQHAALVAGNPAGQIGVIMIASLNLFEDTVRATLSHPEPGRTNLCQILVGLMDDVPESGGELTKLIKRVRDIAEEARG